MKKISILLLLTVLPFVAIFGQNMLFSCKIGPAEQPEWANKHSVLINRFDSLTSTVSEQTYQKHQWNLEYYIDLVLDDKEYKLRLRWRFHDVVDQILLSFGCYSEENNGVMKFYDQVNGFTLFMRQISDDEIIVDKGFGLICDLKLKYRWISEKSLSMLNINIEDVMRVRDEYRCQSDLHEFMPGLYETCHPSCSFQMYIYENNTYEYFDLNSIILSKGTWKREGNLLTFYENDFGEVFTALIEKDGIISKRFFGDYSDEKYRIIPEEEYIDMTPWIPE